MERPVVWILVASFAWAGLCVCVYTVTLALALSTLLTLVYMESKCMWIYIWSCWCKYVTTSRFICLGIPLLLLILIVVGAIYAPHNENTPKPFFSNNKDMHIHIIYMWQSGKSSDIQPIAPNARENAPLP